MEQLWHERPVNKGFAIGGMTMAYLLTIEVQGSEDVMSKNLPRKTMIVSGKPREHGSPRNGHSKSETGGWLIRVQ